ncbi:AIM24 family protein [Cellulomonas soli]
MRSELFHNTERAAQPGSFVLQNPRMLKVDLAGTGGYFFALQGSMVAYQGDVDFAYEGAGGVAKLLKKALTGEGMSLMKVSGNGDVFLARDADEIFLLQLEGSRSRSAAATCWRSRARSAGTSTGSRARRC